MMRIVFRPAGAVAAAVLACGVATSAATALAEDLEAVLTERAGADSAAVQAQARIDNFQEETQTLVSRYRQALADAQSFARYNEQLEAQVGSQKTAIDDMHVQLSEIENTHRAVLPLLQRMVDTLEQFVKLDVPFLVEERTRRLGLLRELMKAADVTPSEKFRRVLEAYQIEMDYGTTLEAYEGPLGEGGQAAETERTVLFARLGRIALLYQTLDGKEAGHWDVEARRWVRDDSLLRNIEEAVRVARKMGAPDMITVPVPAPKGDNS